MKKTYYVIRGKLKKSGKWEDQAYRYPKANWPVAQARSHCKRHKGRFEAAKKKGSQRQGTEKDIAIEEISLRTFSIRAEDFREEDNSMPITLITENRVLNIDRKTFQIVEEILLIDAADIPESRQIPLLDTHDRWTIEKVIGSIREISTSGKKVIGRMFISSTEEKTITKVREGHITDCSGGYVVRERVIINPKSEGMVNGRNYKAGDMPLSVVTRWDLREGSLCPIGADKDAKIRSLMIDRDTFERIRKVMSEQEETMEEDTRDETEEEEIEEDTPPAEQPPEDAQEPPESERKAAIYDLTPRGLEEVAERCIIDGKTVEEARKMLLEEHTKRCKPAGTPEAPPVDTREEKKQEPQLKDIDDKTMARTLTGG